MNTSIDLRSRGSGKLLDEVSGSIGRLRLAGSELAILACVQSPHTIEREVPQTHGRRRPVVKTQPGPACDFLESKSVPPAHVEWVVLKFEK